MKWLIPIITLLFVNSSCSFNKSKILKIAFIDTEFCIDNFESLPVPIHSQFNSELQTEANSKCDLSIENKAKFHGHYVLDVFLKEIDSSKPIEIFPINVFTSNGEQKLENWLRAFKYIEQKEIDVIIMASAYISESEFDSLKIRTDKLIFASAGTKKPFWDKVPYLWPQSSDLKNIYRIGHFYIPLSGTISHHTGFVGHYDTSLITSSPIDYFIGASSVQGVKIGGSSFAVAEFGRIIINNCFENLLQHDTNSLKLCITGQTKEAKLSNNQTVKIFK